MSFIFLGAESHHWRLSGGGTYDSTSGTNPYDTRLARRSCRLFNDSLYEGDLDSAESDMYTTCFLNFDDTTNSLHDQRFQSFFNGSQGIMRFRMNSGEIRLERWDSGAWAQVLDTNTNFGANDIRHRWTTRFLGHASTGVMQAWIGERLICDFSGDTLGDSGETTVDQIHMDAPAGSNNLTTHQVWMSEFMAATHPIHNARLALLVPTSDSGTNNAWSGGEADVDEGGDANDGDLCDSDTADQIQGFGFGDIHADFVDMFPAELRVSNRMTKGASGPAQWQGHVRLSSSDFFGATKALTTSLRPEHHPFVVNPDTSNPWTHAEINGAEYGFKSIT